MKHHIHQLTVTSPSDNHEAPEHVTHHAVRTIAYLILMSLGTLALVIGIREGNHPLTLGSLVVAVSGTRFLLRKGGAR